MNVTKVAALVRQPSTVLGLSALVGTLTAVLTAQLTWQSAVPAIAGALAAIALPDNPRAQAAIKDGAAAVVTAEQMVTQASKETTVVGVAKAVSMIALLLASGLGLSACTTIQPSMQAHAPVGLQNTSPLAMGADIPAQAAGAVVAAAVAYKAARAVR